MSELAMDVCDECGGDGSFDEPAAATPVTIVCASCQGKGFVWRACEAAGEDWIAQEYPSAPVPPAPPSLNHGGPGICTLCHPKGRGLFA